MHMLLLVCVQYCMHAGVSDDDYICINGVMRERTIFFLFLKNPKVAQLLICYIIRPCRCGHMVVGVGAGMVNIHTRTIQVCTNYVSCQHVFLSLKCKLFRVLYVPEHNHIGS